MDDLGQAWAEVARLEAERQRQAEREHAARHRGLRADLVARMQAISQDRQEWSDNLSLGNVVPAGENQQDAAQRQSALHEYVRQVLGTSV